MKLFIASDHAGFELKEKICLIGRGLGVEWEDLGPSDGTSVDYPVYAQKLVEAVLAQNDEAALLGPCGVLICGSGVGMSIAANRHRKIRAALCQTPLVAELSRQHNASNVLCLGSRLLTGDEAMRTFETWFKTPFEGGRHARRVALMDAKLPVGEQK